MIGRVAIVLGLLAVAGAGCKTIPLPAGDGAAVADPALGAGSAATETPPAAVVADLNVGERPHPATDEAGFWLLADRSEKTLESSGGVVRDPGLNRYLREITCRLAGPHCADIRVYVLRVPAFNATMSPNGMMVVWTGLLLRVRDEAELAAVLGHEIGHYLKRHSIQRIRQVINTSGFLTFFSMGLGVAGVPAIADLATLAAMGSISSFSRDNEREADTLGVERMAAAGYDPHGAARVWKNLIREFDAADVERKFDFFLSTHPQSSERAEKLEHAAERLAAGQRPAGQRYRERFRTALAPHRFRLLRDELRMRHFKRSLALIDMLIEDGHGLSDLHYYRGEVHRLRDNATENDREKAKSAYREALGHPKPSPDIYRSIGLLAHRSGEREAARAAFLRYLELRPDTPERNMFLSMIGGLG